MQCLQGHFTKTALSISSFCRSKEQMDLHSFPPLLYLTRKKDQTNNVELTLKNKGVAVC